VIPKQGQNSSFRGAPSTIVFSTAVVGALRHTALLRLVVFLGPAAQQRAGPPRPMLPELLRPAAAAAVLCRCPAASAVETFHTEQLVLRSNRTGRLHTYVVCPGVLYGAGEADDQLHGLWKRAWEGQQPLQVTGRGIRKVYVCWEGGGLAGEVGVQLHVLRRLAWGQQPPLQVGGCGVVCAGACRAGVRQRRMISFMGCGGKQCRAAAAVGGRVWQGGKDGAPRGRGHLEAIMLGRSSYLLTCLHGLGNPSTPVF
jgi:hypothetical protein